MIKTIIFDIGGVLVGYDWTAYLMKEFNSNIELVEKIKANIFGNHKWDEVDRGVLTNDELVELFTKDAPEIRDEIIHFWDTCGDALWQYDFAKDWITELKNRGYQLLYLSNWSSHLRQLAAKQLDFLPMLDGGVFSYEEKLIKPDHAIYNRIIEKYNLVPSECVFIDDTERNIIGARECGLNAVHAKDKNHEIAVKELEALLK
ncbi:HAD family hydrolase [Pseudobutyrivibrio sp. MD2005]|uniref:HAD family hydrolase n=1 Tax=Pseudobutyrivibrio sp. MD2005 TaxID=1410616 RepID=UPI000685E042|nr:HAD family phosphatase [Pseudobutyrivibrio sp. MD2005]